jgi:hypothetical protein
MCDKRLLPLLTVQGGPPRAAAGSAGSPRAPLSPRKLLLHQSGVMERDLATMFEANRPRLQAMAYRMLGSLTEAEDAVQETWIRLSGSDAEHIDNLGGWLTTVLSGVCLGGVAHPPQSQGSADRSRRPGARRLQPGGRGGPRRHDGLSPTARARCPQPRRTPRFRAPRPFRRALRRGGPDPRAFRGGAASCPRGPRAP